MTFILFCICFIISFSINVFYLFNAFVPLLWLPYVFYNICKKEYKLSAILMCIMPPIIWNVGLILLGFILTKIGLYKYLNIFFNTPGAALGGLFAIICVILKMFSAQAKQEFKNNLESFKIGRDNK